MNRYFFYKVRSSDPKLSPRRSAADGTHSSSAFLECLNIIRVANAFARDPIAKSDTRWGALISNPRLGLKKGPDYAIAVIFVAFFMMPTGHDVTKKFRIGQVQTDTSGGKEAEVDGGGSKDARR
ncbi:hypothetical protein L596_019028 [Steinernema carpocapsae]|uniref:Uncharacterized protein n=1 Tax=Steinernema carpocapsae TaxID=34508 RepID=A0A4U5N6E8_STECR|nr:hypothetical protein L596_019028 [Steinernema carpocapsae]